MRCRAEWRIRNERISRKERREEKKGRNPPFSTWATANGLPAISTQSDDPVLSAMPEGNKKYPSGLSPSKDDILVNRKI
jgi:hypothetical protein